MKVSKPFFIILIFISVVNIITLNGQAIIWKNISVEEAAKVYIALNNHYCKTSSYSLKVKYSSFQDYYTSSEHETSSGYFCKYGSNYHSYLMGIHTIQNANYKIVLDTSRKIVAVLNPDKAFEKSITMIDYNEILKNCTAIKVAIVGNEKHYRVEFKETYYVNAYEYAINNTGWLNELTLFYNKNYVDEDGKEKNVKPRLKITFSDIKENVKEEKNEFDENKYFSKLGYKIILNNKYKNYYLSDQRVVPN